MVLKRTLLVVTLALSAAAVAAHAAEKAPACPEGETFVRGKCWPTCAAQGRFQNPNDCQCPAGFGKIFVSGGAGECRRLACRRDTVVDPALCDCDPGQVMKKLAKGKGKCVEAKPVTAKAPAK